MANNVLVLVMFFLFLLSLSTFSEAARSVPAMYVFGDSLVDVGNNNYLTSSMAKANFPPNGIDFPTKTPTGRFGNGKNAADILVEKVGLPTLPPYLSLVTEANKSNLELFQTGVNFASGGSGIISQKIQKLPQSLPLAKQVDNYAAVHEALKQQSGSSATDKHFSTSLFLFVTGSNDIFGYFESAASPNKSTSQQFVNFMALSLKGQLKRLYEYGARKFVISGVGVIGCTPYGRSKNNAEACNEELNYWSMKYNEVLKSTLNNLKAELKGINYSYFDGYRLLHNFIQKPAIYGFAEVKAACCGLGKLNAEVPCLPFSQYCLNRRNHLFWDRSHPTEEAHRIFVDYIFDGPLQYTFPMNVKKLISI